MSSGFMDIMNRDLALIPSDIDKREGSLIWNALAAFALEFADALEQINTNMDECFADTSSMVFLPRRCAERGITPYAASKAIMKGEFNKEVPIDSRFSIGILFYTVKEQADDYDALTNKFYYKLECDTLGVEPNYVFGSLLAVTYVEGLGTAEITECLIPGENAETVEELRVRYFDSLNNIQFGGNIADYKVKTKAIDGVVEVKVYPVWAGPGTVKLVILGSDYSAPTPTFVTEVQNLVDPTVNSAQGLGFAPIDHLVTVAGVTETAINTTFTLTYEDGYDWSRVETEVKAIIDNYLLELAKDWENQSALIVRISQLESRILDVQGIVDIADTTINTFAVNLTLGADSIPVRGTINGL